MRKMLTKGKKGKKCKKCACQNIGKEIQQHGAADTGFSIHFLEWNDRKRGVREDREIIKN